MEGKDWIIFKTIGYGRINMGKKKKKRKCSSIYAQALKKKPSKRSMFEDII